MNTHESEKKDISMNLPLKDVNYEENYQVQSVVEPSPLSSSSTIITNPNQFCIISPWHPYCLR